MLKIALTGGIASGKTLASKTLESMGACIIDADIVSREVASSNECKELLKRAFGAEFFNEDGELNRRKLREYVFAEPQRVKLLNSITHPLIRRRIEEKLKELSHLPVVFVVIPVLIESGMIDMFDRVWTIASDPKTRIKRLIRRDNITEEQAYNMLKSQVSEEERVKIADVVIHNDGDENEFVQQVKNHYRDLMRELGIT
ncbi:MAG TPA: dephospho-CoA kinase [Clostridia bacterium]